MINIAAYKATGKLTDQIVRAALSVKHRKLVKYSHVELFDQGGWCIAASKRDNARVRRTQIDFKPGHWDFISIDGDIWQKVTNRLGHPYDLTGAILCVTSFARLHPNSEWCSGMIAKYADWENPERYDPHMVIEKAIGLGGKLIVG